MTRPSTQDAFGANFVTRINTPEEEGEQRGEGEAARRHQVGVYLLLSRVPQILYRYYHDTLAIYTIFEVGAYFGTNFEVETTCLLMPI